jgi:hypothetical protein
MPEERAFLIDRMLVQKRQRENVNPVVPRDRGSFLGRRRDGCGN